MLHSIDEYIYDRKSQDFNIDDVNIGFFEFEPEQLITDQNLFVEDNYAW